MVSEDAERRPPPVRQMREHAAKLVVLRRAAVVAIGQEVAGDDHDVGRSVATRPSASTRYASATGGPTCRSPIWTSRAPVSAVGSPATGSPRSTTVTQCGSTRHV
jgi:hypothetical protein